MSAIKKFLKHDSASGILLILAAILALITNNSFLAESYEHILHTHLKVQIGSFGVDKSLGHWINDGLMTIFFLVVGLEIKREMMEGALAEFKKALLPFVAAIGGVIFPALIYVFFNYNNPETIQGWGIPVATDIAFAVGILSLLSRHVPKELKILLLSLAIIDDLAAILIIAVFYTENISFSALGGAAIALSALILLNYKDVKSLKPYVIIGTILWFLILKSGVHATIAGVLLAFTIPLNISKDKTASPLKRMEHNLYALAAFGIMPLFAFANAGFSFNGMTPSLLLGSVPLGIILGLFFGKQIGVFSFIWLGDALKIIEKPKDISWKQIYGMSILTGVGFTVSLFIGSLAFSDPAYIAQVRLSVLLASTLAAITGYIMLKYSSKWSEITLDNINPISHPEVLAENQNASLSEENASSASSRASE